MQTFIKREVNVTFELAYGAFKTDEKAEYDTITISGLRTIARISAGGNAWYSGHITIFGLSVDVMERLIAFKKQNIGNEFAKNKITLTYGEDVLYSGTIICAMADYNLAPSIPLVIESSASFPYQGQVPDGGLEFKGQWRVVDIFKAFASVANKNFVNAGVSDLLVTTDRSYNGDLQSMMDEAADEFGISVIYNQNSQIIICERGLSRNDMPETTLGPENGLIGFPVLIDYGCHVRALYSPTFVLLRKIVLDTPEMPRTHGKTYLISSITHEIDSAVPSGEWTSSMVLGEPLFDRTIESGE